MRDGFPYWTHIDSGLRPAMLPMARVQFPVCARSQWGFPAKGAGSPVRETGRNRAKQPRRHP